MLSLTSSAQSAVRRVLAEANIVSGGLRIAVRGMGCTGFDYRLGLEENPFPDDEVIEFEGVRVFVDAFSLPSLEGTVIDFVDSAEGAGFVFVNPNAKAGCAGCHSDCGTA